MTSTENYLRNVAIVGAGGQVGTYIVKELLKNDKIKVTAITREGSTSSMPAGVEVKSADYNDPSSLTNALKGQDAVLITMAITAPPDTSQKLIQAAADAKVPWIVPNEWGIDYSNDELGKDTGLGRTNLANRALVEKLGVSSWVAISCSFWYEFSLGGTSDRFGFDFPNRKVIFFDDGEEKINTSTFPHCARAAAAVLGLPVQSEDGTACLNDYKNKAAYVSSFLVSQKDMFKAVKRVTDTSDKDWEITYEPVKERFQGAKKDFEAGDFSAIGKMMYSRMFFPNGGGNFEATRGLDNERLGLSQDDFDEYTKLGVQMGLEGSVGDADKKRGEDMKSSDSGKDFIATHGNQS